MANNNDSPYAPRVLIVDDEEDFLAVLVKRLSKRNLRVVPATRGIEALHILSLLTRWSWISRCQVSAG